LRAASAKTLVLSMIAIILSHRPLHRLFAADNSSPEALFQAYAEFSATE
jgi:hypothetical protein